MPGFSVDPSVAPTLRPSTSDRDYADVAARRCAGRTEGRRLPHGPRLTVTTTGLTTASSNTARDSVPARTTQLLLVRWDR